MAPRSSREHLSSPPRRGHQLDVKACPSGCLCDGAKEIGLPRTCISCKEIEGVGRWRFEVIKEAKEGFPLVAREGLLRERTEVADEGGIRHVIIISIFVRVKLLILACIEMHPGSFTTGHV